MYRNLYILSVALTFLISCQKKSSQTDLTSVPIIPKPVSVVSSGGVFELKATTNIYVKTGSKEWAAVAEYLAGRLKPSTGFELKIVEAQEPPTSGIYFTSGGTAELGEEGYELAITENLITITSNKPAGAFRAIQTIRQLLPSKIEMTSAQQGPWEIATGTIRDFPTYSYRGVMLDVARHFFSVEEVKIYIDQLALYKINFLHLHLSDDQGWRIEIKSWPNLTAHGGKKEVGGGAGGFYTQEQYTELINYALSHYITIVPEIDMPGHINSALASYGELNGGTIVPVEGRVPINASNNILDGKLKPTELYTGTQVGWSTLRIEKEVTFKFIDDVVREISAITPGPYFHVGGDEAQVTKKEDYIAFVNRFQEIVKAHGKKMIGWEEIAQGNITTETVTQHWKLPKYALMAIEKESKLIVSPAEKAYLDMQYDSTTKLGLHWAAYIEVDKAYNWNPASLVNGIGKENILGIEAPLWSETISNSDEIEFLTFPRLLGYAEIGWSPDANRNWDEYKIRLGKHAPRMKALGIDFYRSKLVEWGE
jgi:hexosaminidase